MWKKGIGTYLEYEDVTTWAQVDAFVSQSYEQLADDAWRVGLGRRFVWWLDTIAYETVLVCFLWWVEESQKIPKAEKGKIVDSLRANPELLYYYLWKWLSLWAEEMKKTPEEWIAIFVSALNKWTKLDFRTKNQWWMEQNIAFTKRVYGVFGKLFSYGYKERNDMVNEIRSNSIGWWKSIGDVPYLWWTSSEVINVFNSDLRPTDIGMVWLLEDSSRQGMQAIEYILHHYRVLPSYRLFEKPQQDLALRQLHQVSDMQCAWVDKIRELFWVSCYVPVLNVVYDDDKKTYVPNMFLEKKVPHIEDMPVFWNKLTHLLFPEWADSISWGTLAERLLMYHQNWKDWYEKNVVSLPSVVDDNVYRNRIEERMFRLEEEFWRREKENAASFQKRLFALLQNSPENGLHIHDVMLLWSVIRKELWDSMPQLVQRYTMYSEEVDESYDFADHYICWQHTQPGMVEDAWDVLWRVSLGDNLFCQICLHSQWEGSTDKPISFVLFHESWGVCVPLYISTISFWWATEFDYITHARVPSFRKEQELLFRNSWVSVEENQYKRSGAVSVETKLWKKNEVSNYKLNPWASLRTEQENAYVSYIQWKQFLSRMTALSRVKRVEDLFALSSFLYVPILHAKKAPSLRQKKEFGGYPVITPTFASLDTQLNTEQEWELLHKRLKLSPRANRWTLRKYDISLTSANLLPYLLDKQVVQLLSMCDSTKLHSLYMMHRRQIEEIIHDDNSTNCSVYEQLVDNIYIALNQQYIAEVKRCIGTLYDLLHERQQSPAWALSKEKWKKRKEKKTTTDEVIIWEKDFLKVANICEEIVQYEWSWPQDVVWVNNLFREVMLLVDIKFLEHMGASLREKKAQVDKMAWTQTKLIGVGEWIVQINKARLDLKIRYSQQRNNESNMDEERACATIDSVIDNQFVDPLIRDVGWQLKQEIRAFVSTLWEKKRRPSDIMDRVSNSVSMFFKWKTYDQLVQIESLIQNHPLFDTILVAIKHLMQKTKLSVSSKKHELHLVRSAKDIERTILLGKSKKRLWIKTYIRMFHVLRVSVFSRVDRLSDKLKYVHSNFALLDHDIDFSESTDCLVQISAMRSMVDRLRLYRDFFDALVVYLESIRELYTTFLDNVKEDEVVNIYSDIDDFAWNRKWIEENLDIVNRLLHEISDLKTWLSGKIQEMNILNRHITAEENRINPELRRTRKKKNENNKRRDSKIKEKTSSLLVNFGSECSLAVKTCVDYGLSEKVSIFYPEIINNVYDAVNEANWFMKTCRDAINKTISTLLRKASNEVDAIMSAKSINALYSTEEEEEYLVHMWHMKRSLTTLSFDDDLLTKIERTLWSNVASGVDEGQLLELRNLIMLYKVYKNMYTERGKAITPIVDLITLLYITKYAGSDFANDMMLMNKLIAKMLYLREWAGEKVWSITLQENEYVTFYMDLYKNKCLGSFLNKHVSIEKKQEIFLLLAEYEEFDIQDKVSRLFSCTTLWELKNEDKTFLELLELCGLLKNNLEGTNAFLLTVQRLSPRLKEAIEHIIKLHSEKQHELHISSLLSASLDNFL